MKNNFILNEKPVLTGKNLSVVFVCSQNTCRSICAEAVLNYLVTQTKTQIQVASAGIHAIPEIPPKALAIQAANLRGYCLSAYSSTCLTAQDFLIHDYLLALDKYVFNELCQRGPAYKEKIRLLSDYRQFFTEFEEIHYPSSSDPKAFAYMFDCIEDACLGLFHFLTQQLEKKK